MPITNPTTALGGSRQTGRIRMKHEKLYDVEWIEDGINKQKTGVSHDEAVSLASKIALRGIVATISVR
jgi:hypothetical protein